MKSTAPLIAILLILTSMVLQAETSPPIEEASLSSELQVKGDRIFLIYNKLVNETDKAVILKELKALQNASKDLYDFLTSNEFYEPDLFYLSHSTRSFLGEIYGVDGKLESCENIQDQLVFIYQSSIKEQEPPNPLLWSIVKKAC